MPVLEEGKSKTFDPTNAPSGQNKAISINSAMNTVNHTPLLPRCKAWSQPRLFSEMPRVDVYFQSIIFIRRKTRPKSLATTQL